ncbi:MAG: trigger factor [Xanthobacteraceae bacterium]|nr:trigger factor [Xanthobacteraceae bacterium]
MQVTETVSDGLKREFQVTVPAADLETRMAGRLNELKDRVQLRGFRPGKVPVNHLRKVYGRSVMAETVETVIRELNAQIVEERGLRLAREPKVTIPNEETEVDRVISGKADLAYTLSFEVLPAITLADFSTIKLEKLVAEVADSEVDDALKQIAEQNKPYEAKGEGAKVESNDRVVIDFVGRVDGAVFPGGTGNDVAVTVGSNQFIPGFEEQLVGLGVGETKVVKVTFPEGYPTETLAGKAAEFDVTAKSIEAPKEVAIDDAFAKSLGLESLEKVKDAVKDRIAREHATMSRQKLKRKLLDQLDAMHKFTPPPTLVEDEFNSIWTTIEGDLKRQNRTFADEGTTEEKAREEYRAIAERRVRLGLLLAEIGDKNSIKVSDEEIQRAIVERARQIPGREQEVWDYYRKNPQAVAGIRAPIYEEKVVDFLLELAKVTDKTVTKEELFEEEEDETAKA